MARRGLRARFGVRPVTAAATQVRRPTQQALPQIGQKSRPWQKTGYGYYDSIGEIWYASQFYSRTLSKLRVFVAQQDTNGEWTEVNDGPVAEAWARVQDPGGGRQELQGRYGKCMFIAGESYLFCSWRDVDKQTVETWEVLSNSELWFRDGIWFRLRAPGAGEETYTDAAGTQGGEPGTAIGFRMWRPHPEFSAQADAPMRAVNDVSEELLLLTRSVRSRTLSRIARSGVLFLPEEMEFPAPDATSGDEDAADDPFMTVLGEHMAEAISDPSSTASVVPMIVRGNAEAIGNVRHVTFMDDSKVYPESELRQEAIERIALGLDMPPEILLGKGDANHWSAWQVDEDAWKAHLAPVADQMVGDFAAAYLLPLFPGEPFVLRYDASDVVIRPNRSADAKDLHDRLVISDATLRDANGFEDDQAPDEEEYNRRVGVKLADASLATGGPITEPSTPPPAPAPPAAGGDDPANTDPSPPDDGQAGVMVAIAHLMVGRSRELAGARLRTALRGKVTGIEDVSNIDLPVHVGEASLRFVAGRYDADSLVAGAGEPFLRNLTAWGVAPDVAAQLVTACEAHAARTLFDASSFVLPRDVVGHCLAAGLLVVP